MDTSGSMSNGSLAIGRDGQARFEGSKWQPLGVSEANRGEAESSRRRGKMERSRLRN